jgi:putative ATPase
MGAFDAVIEEDALSFLADVSGGDARSALNALELGVLTTPRSEDGKIRITLEVAAQCIQKRVARYDKDGDQHYDTISAFIKSMRGSDPDAAVFYLARMLEAGEDIRFIARRIIICASEDVGMANPQALVVAVSAAQAVERIGLPESQLILAHAAICVAVSPKSNSCTEAIFAARKAVRENTFSIPPYLQDAHYKGSASLNRGIGYEYAHDYPKHFSRQRYLPEELGEVHFYEPSDNGFEKQVQSYLDWIHEP